MALCDRIGISMTAALPASLLRFIVQCIPTLQAAEVLLFFAANRDRAFKAEDIAAAMRPALVTVPAIKEYLGLFKRSGVITEDDEQCRYAPATHDIEEAVALLARAYNERPVTLIGAIYKIADSRIQSFSDSFKLRED
jgi:hypothetical protein